MISKTLFIALWAFSGMNLGTTPSSETEQTVVDFTRDTDKALPDFVSPFPARALSRSANKPGAELMGVYYDSVVKWGAILASRFENVPGHDDWGYYGDPGNQENDVRPITYAALVNAFLSEAESAGTGPDSKEKERCRREAIAALAYLVQGHVTGPGTCLNGKPWGDQWQSAMWARCAALAGWMLWDRLEPSLRLGIAKMAEHEADRFLTAQPKSSEFNDTGAEENAWNAGMLSLARVMMPNHPRAKSWDEAAKTYLYNSLSMERDARDQRPGDDGRTVSDWVTTINAHPDATVENHGLVHVGYLKTASGLMLEAGSQYLLGELQAPQACMHHMPEAFENLMACMAWDGAPIYFGGNDWKLVHTQATDVLIYTMLGLFAGDGSAAYLERTALAWARRIQEHEAGYFNVRRDIEYGGLVASRFVACYMAHAMCGSGAEPLDEDAFQRQVCGLHKLEYGKAILHRTPTKFASFSWGPKRMGLVLPENGSWVIWPHYGSYLGMLNGEDASEKQAELTTVKTGVAENAFATAVRLRRCGGTITHDAVFVSPPEDMVFYLERLALRERPDRLDRRTGIIGHEYPLDANEREVYFEGGTTRLTGQGNEKSTRPFRTDWFNIGNQIGYVVKRESGRNNVVRYEDLEKGGGRVPKLQEWCSLIGDEQETPWEDGEDYACLVTFPNQPAKRTAEAAGKVRFERSGNTASLRCPPYELRVDFDALTVTLTPGISFVWE